MTDPWAGVVGQERAIAALQAAARTPVHAYLLVGPRGSGKRDLARAFAASLLSSTAPDDPDRAANLALAGRHPDLHEFERAGPYITVEQADSIIREASRSGVESSRKVLVLVDFHLVQPAVEAKLLKTIEEPPADTVFVVLAETVSTLLEPIASRCVRIEVDPLSPSVVRDALIAEGVDPETASSVSAAAGGDLARARLLATDPRFSLRQQAWAGIPHALDDTGATVARLVSELRAMIDDAAAPLEARHAVEITDLEERIERYGERGSRQTGARRPPPPGATPASHRRDPVRAGHARGQLPRHLVDVAAGARPSGCGRGDRARRRRAPVVGAEPERDVAAAGAAPSAAGPALSPSRSERDRRFSTSPRPVGHEVDELAGQPPSPRPPWIRAAAERLDHTVLSEDGERRATRSFADAERARRRCRS